MPSRKKNKSNKNKKPSTASAPPITLAPDTTLGASPANIPHVKAAISSVVASHGLNVQSIIKNSVNNKDIASKPAATSMKPIPPKVTPVASSTPAGPPPPPEKPAGKPEPVEDKQPPAVLPKNEPMQVGKTSEPEAPVITAPTPVAVTGNHISATGNDPTNQAQRPLPQPERIRRPSKKDKMKKKCIIL